MTDKHEPTPLLPCLPDNIPDPLKAEKRWALWEAKWLPEKGKWDKIPHRADKPEQRLSTAKPHLWSNFEDAHEALMLDFEEEFAGLGYLMTGTHGIVGYDLDHCVAGGLLEPWAQEIIDLLGSYTEFSPSGTGVRVFCFGVIERDWTDGTKLGIECYAGHHARFLTVTGQRVPGTAGEVRKVAADIHTQLMSQYAAPLSEADAADADMPEIPDAPRDFRQIEGLSSAVREFLAQGEHDGDRSAMLHQTGVELYSCGLSDAEVLGILYHNEHVMEIALEKRRAREDKALRYIWREHCVKAKPKARIPVRLSDFDGLDDPADAVPPVAVPLPDAIARTLRFMARECELELPEFCSEIAFDPNKCRAAINAAVLNQSNSKFVVVTPSGDYRVFTEKNFINGLYASVGSFYTQHLLEALLQRIVVAREMDAAEGRRFVEGHRHRISKAVMDYITIERQFGTISIKVDMFTSRASIHLHDGCASITFPHIPFTEGEVDPAVIADYKVHWPHLDQFLELLAATRFAAARKKAYLWIRAESDWGKGALESILDTHGLVVSMSVRELEKLFDGGPVGRQMADFRRAWVLLFNEFKTAKSELKMLEQKIQFSPKNMPVCFAELYLKLFTSAEEVESLVSEDSGIEDQFANRFSLIQPTGNLDERPLFRAGKKHYLASLSAYVGVELNRMVLEYVALGREGAANRGDKIVEGYHKRYGIDTTYNRLSSKIDGLVEEFITWLKSGYIIASREHRFTKRGLSGIEKTILEASNVKHESGEYILYVRRPKTLFSRWLETEFNQSERGKLVVKSAEFTKRLPEAKWVRFGKHEKHKVIQIGAIPDPEALFEDDVS
jgi:hypothetical protein